MDAPEDRDIWVSRNSSELLAELLDSIPRLINQRNRPELALQPRTSLSGAAVSHITRLIDSFQEWPQLLDPKLDALLGPLNEAFLKALLSAEGDLRTPRQRKSPKLCFPQAWSIIMYSFCKVRGSKVIIRFLSNEAKYLRFILNALEIWTATTKEKSPELAPLSWEERYVLLLWLSHLLLTPFDLSTIGLEAIHDSEIIHTEGLDLPTSLPPICQRAISVAIENLSSASKERESAVLVLVRIGLRPDMRRLELDKKLVRWAITQLQALHKSKKESGYKFIALLSFLAAFIKSADTLAVAPILLQIFNFVEQLGVLHSGTSSALTRKAVVKIYSACSVIALSLEENPNEELHFSANILESAVDELLTALGDNDTPVRQSASKALAVIATKLDPAMAAEISEAVIQGLDENVVWEVVKNSSHVEEQNYPIRQRNLSLVNPSKWQGLVLTLSQLLFRRVSPVTQLPAVLNCLISALSFEQRSSTGASLGTNVRDAACFGIWALSRRYSTTELLAVDSSAIPAAMGRVSQNSVIQLLAIELLITATLDPAGNIRRGASAALQELIGRHPDTVLHGIPLVQIVDYHAIALRSKAMQDVAVSASRLDNCYWTAIQTELTNWRGIGAHDVESRRLAATTFGVLSVTEDFRSFQPSKDLLLQSLDALKGATMQKRQGILLALSAMVRASVQHSEAYRSQVDELNADCWTLLTNKTLFSEDELVVHASRPELWTEAVALLICELSLYVKNGNAKQKPHAETLEACFNYLGHALDRQEPVVLENAINAIRSLMEITEVHEQNTWIEQTIERTKQEEVSAGGMRPGHILALASVQAYLPLDALPKQEILQHLEDAAKSKFNIDTRVVALQGLTKILSDKGPGWPLTEEMVEILRTALQDYTTDQRGDIGSVLRLGAIDGVRTAFEQGSLQVSSKGPLLLQQVCILAGEKLDKVRMHAWNCLAACWNMNESVKKDTPSYNVLPRATGIESPTNNSSIENFSSVAYYRQLIHLLQYNSLRLPILQGVFISAGGGSETVLVASRHALAEWLQGELSRTDLGDICRCIEDLLSNSLGNDRALVPTLETLTFVLQTNIFTGQDDSTMRWRKIFVLVQKAHFKTSNMPKLLAAIDIYCELGIIQSVREDVLIKLLTLLTHPFPRVRNVAADALFILTGESSLKPTNWADSTKYTKQALLNVKESLGLTV